MDASRQRNSEPGAEDGPAAVYRKRVAAAKEDLGALERTDARIANARVLMFLSAWAMAGLVIFHVLSPSFWIAASAFALGYAALAIFHDRILKRKEREKIRVEINERGLARLDGGWRAFLEKGDRFIDPGHPYTSDLDIFGQGSLFQLLNETATRRGEDRLASWLSAPADSRTIAERQVAIRELAGDLDFRQSLVIEAQMASRHKPDPTRLIAWAEKGPALQRIRWARPLAWIFPIFTAASYVLGQIGLLPSRLAWFGLACLIAVVTATGRYFASEYRQLASGEGRFLQFYEAFGVIQSASLKSAPLRELTNVLVKDQATFAMRRFARLFSFAELRQSPQLHALINVLTLWDVHWFFALERWRSHWGAQAKQWFEALADFEALGCLAGFAHDWPSYAYPEIVRDGPRFSAREIGHPLLSAPVRNDVELPGPKHALLVTGSNMSGKSTLLRAMGINAVLALAGAPACARAFQISELRVLTSMQVKDSLEHGISYFYAQVQRIKSVLDAATHSGGRVLFLLDEILPGTNTRERQIASREILRLLLEAGSIGAIATHDLSLAVLSEDRRFSLRNVHFRDRLENGRMVFDYRVHDGVVQGTNALRLLREMGIQIEE